MMKFNDYLVVIIDTIASFLKFTNGKFKHIIVMNWKVNFKKLNDYISSLESKDKITTIKAGVYYKNKTFI